jgi:cobalt/nickel transport system permease protein
MLAYKYIFILSKTIEETYFALKSRLIRNIKNKNTRKLISGRVFFIFRRSKTNYENTYYAMVSRGYTGKIFFNSKKHFEAKDIVAFIIIVAFGIGILFFSIIEHRK